GASVVDVESHVAAVKTMLDYRGLSGFLRNLLDRIGVIWGRPKPPGVGSRGWEARIEVKKITERIVKVHEEMAKSPPGMKPEDAAAFLDYLQKQAEYHARAINDLETGVGYIAQK